MMGWEDNFHPDCFWQADFMEATGRLVRLIRKHRPDIVTIYDPFGGYGHPDHIQVHRIGIAAFHGHPISAFPAGRRGGAMASRIDCGCRFGRGAGWRRGPISTRPPGTIDANEAARRRNSGFPDERINVWMDVEDLIEVKVAAIAAHRTQIPPDWALLNVPEAHKPALLGHEAFVELYPSAGQAPAKAACRGIISPNDSATTTRSSPA